MMRPRPYLFCRYSLLVDEEPLDVQAQLNALQELQGQMYARGPTAEREGRFDSLVMRPRSMTIDEELVITWSVGQLIDYRVGVRYDERNDRLDTISIEDGTVRYSDFVSIPRLNVIAVDDRTGDRHLGGKGAIARFRAVFRNLDGGAANIEMTMTSADMDHALRSWDLQQVSFKVRPFNPHARDDLSRRMSEAMRREGIGNLQAVGTPEGPNTMRPNEGLIDQALSLTEDGYGQMGVRGVMQDGHVAYIPRPKFESERSQNQKIQAKPRELRVYIESEGDTDNESFQDAAKAMIGFYDRES